MNHQERRFWGRDMRKRPFARLGSFYLEKDPGIIRFLRSKFARPGGDSLTSTEHLRTSPEFAKNPMGKYVDPDKVIAAREAGASPWELHERAAMTIDLVFSVFPSRKAASVSPMEALRYE